MVSVMILQKIQQKLPKVLQKKKRMFSLYLFQDHRQLVIYKHSHTHPYKTWKALIIDVDTYIVCFYRIVNENYRKK